MHGCEPATLSGGSVKWAKSARGVSGLHHGFAGELYSSRDDLEGKCVPTGLSAPVAAENPAENPAKSQLEAELPFPAAFQRRVMSMFKVFRASGTRAFCTAIPCIPMYPMTISSCASPCCYVCAHHVQHMGILWFGVMWPYWFLTTLGTP